MPGARAAIAGVLSAGVLLVSIGPQVTENGLEVVALGTSVIALLLVPDLVELLKRRNGDKED